MIVKSNISTLSLDVKNTYITITKIYLKKSIIEASNQKFIMKIYLVRHGEMDIKLKGWMNVLGYAKLLRKYNRAGIITNKKSSTIVSHIIKPDAKYFSSDFPRAAQTAIEVLTTGNITQDKLFREIDLPIIKFPIITNYYIWRTLSRFIWLISIRNKQNFWKSRKRVSMAALKLMDEAEKHDVVLFGHGMMNTLLALELKLNGWKCHIPILNNYWNVIILKQ